MKKAFILLISGSIAINCSLAQETLQSVTDRGSVTNKQITAGTTYPGAMFTGRQVGSGYANVDPSGAVFYAMSDGTTPSANYFFSGYHSANGGAGSGVLSYSVRADGQAYFSGNVGIGTTSPISKLHVYTNSDVYAASFGNELYNLRVAGTAEGPYGYSLLQSFYNNAPGGKIILQRDAGNVGIGTTSPAYKLDVNGSIHSPNLGDLVPSLYLGSNTISDNIYQIQFGQNDDNQLGMGYYTSSKSVWSRWGLGIHVRENAEFTIKSSGWKNLFGVQGGTGNAWFTGKVGIGTIDPQSELAVKGTITSKKVKVTQDGWADYVFDSSYQLLPLHQVEKYIQQNKHLPEVPSTAEVKKDGLDLGDNQAVLLKKIEELTLYIIQQNKELAQQSKKLEAQDERLKKLEASAK